MKGIWEVLDEGVGGSLPTHLQELLPSCKGEQSLTFKETQASTSVLLSKVQPLGPWYSQVYSTSNTNRV